MSFSFIMIMTIFVCFLADKRMLNCSLLCHLNVRVGIVFTWSRAGDIRSWLRAADETVPPVPAHLLPHLPDDLPLLGHVRGLLGQAQLRDDGRAGLDGDTRAADGARRDRVCRGNASSMLQSMNLLNPSILCLKEFLYFLYLYFDI